MKTTVAIGLCTCHREEYALETVETFLAHNDPQRFIMLHADDASSSPVNIETAAETGFKTVHMARQREGQLAMLRALLDAAVEHEAEWFLWCESDWRWLAPFPWPLMCGGWECLRLYGATKAVSGSRAPTGTHVMGTPCKIEWQSEHGGECDGAIAHWAGPPSVCRTADLRRAAKDAASFKDVSRWFRPYTWRLHEAIVTHIGERQTPGFKP